jgi:lipopolysaccharide export system permease protein
MKTIPRYVLRHFFPVFALALSAFVGLYLVIDFFEKADNLLEKHVPFFEICRYFLFKIPFIVTQGIPILVLLSTLIALGILKKNRELVALRAAGVATTYYTAPILAAALAISLAHFICGETITRSMTQKSQQIWDEQVKHNKSSMTWSKENVWYRGHNVIYQIRLCDLRRQVLEKVSLFFLDPRFGLVQRLDAKRLEWDGHKWKAKDGLVLSFTGSSTQQECFKEKDLDLAETPKDFSRIETIPEELDWLSMYEYVRKVRQEGFNATPFEVELNVRLALPLTTFILALLGTTIALRQGLHGGIAVGIGLALILAFVYFTVFQIGCSLATAGVLPVGVGVWAGDIIFGVLAGYLWLTDPGY